MTPINLAALPSNQPAPTPLVQIKRGVADTAVNVNNTVAYGTKLSDGSGGFMQISVTPTYNCWWVVRANVMSHGIDYGWERWDWGIMISPADAEGVTLGAQRCMQTYPNSTVEWRTASASYCFRLNAGVAYTAYLTHQNSSGYTQAYHTGPRWVRIMGRLVSEGVL
jgi:hypothetical protein